MASRINLINDVVPPVVVAGVNIFAKKSTQTVGTMPIAEVASYAMTGLGYLAAWMKWGKKYSDVLKNIGIASAPTTLELLYNKMQTPAPVARTAARMSRPVSTPVSMNRVSRYPGPASESPFQGVRLT